MRTIVDLPEQDVRRLDAIAAQLKRSRAAEIRAAVERHLRAVESNAWIWGDGFGYWRDRDDIGDAVEYQRAARADHDDD